MEEFSPLPHDFLLKILQISGFEAKREVCLNSLMIYLKSNPSNNRKGLPPVIHKRQALLLYLDISAVSSIFVLVCFSFLCHVVLCTSPLVLISNRFLLSFEYAMGRSDLSLRSKFIEAALLPSCPLPALKLVLPAPNNLHSRWQQPWKGWTRSLPLPAQ